MSGGGLVPVRGGGGNSASGHGRMGLPHHPAPGTGTRPPPRSSTSPCPYAPGAAARLPKKGAGREAPPLHIPLSLRSRQRQGQRLGLALFVQRGEEGVDHFGVKLGSRAALQFRSGGLYRHGLAVGALRGHGIERIDDGEDARTERNIGSGKAIWIAGAIPAFMVRNDQRGQGAEGSAKFFKNAAANFGMLLHYRPLLVGQRAGLVQNGVWNADLADVMQDRAQAQQVHLFLGKG